MATSQTLSIIAKNLEDTTWTSWSTGYLEDFSKWSAKMKTTINGSVPVIRAAAEQQQVLENRIFELEKSLAEKDKLIATLIAKL